MKNFWLITITMPASNSCTSPDGNVVAVKPAGQRPAPHHVPHGEIHQHQQKADRGDEPPFQLGRFVTQPLLNTKHTINNMNSEYYIEDGSFFRIRNVSLAYNFDKALISKIGMQALKLYVNIQNLKTWKHNTGYTPELGGSAIAFGVDDGSYPMPAIYTFGFNLTF